MYTWKCWRDTRTLFLIFFVIAVAIMPVLAAASSAKAMKNLGLMAFQSTFALLGAIAALGIGAHGAGEGFAPSTLQFLFSKPRSRATFVWTGWAVGAAELLGITVASILTAWLTLARYSGASSRAALFHSLLGRQTADGMMSFFYAYCLAYGFTIVLRGAVKGLGATIAISLGAEALAGLFRLRWNIVLPLPSMPIGKLPLLASDIVWVLVALLILSAAQAITARAEI